MIWQRNLLKLAQSDMVDAQMGCTEHEVSVV